MKNKSMFSSFEIQSEDKMSEIGKLGVDSDGVISKRKTRYSSDVDGGWGWMIATAGCIIHFLMGANNKGRQNGGTVKKGGGFCLFSNMHDTKMDSFSFSLTQSKLSDQIKSNQIYSLTLVALVNDRFTAHGVVIQH